MGTLLIILMLVSLVGSFYSTMAQSALLNFSHARLDAMPMSARRRRLVDAHLANRNSLLLTVSILDMVWNVLFVMLLSLHWASPEPDALLHVQFLEVFVLALLGLVVFGELLPWVCVHHRAEHFLGGFLSPVAAAARVLKPLLNALAFVNTLINRILGHPQPFGSGHQIEDEILSVVASGEKDGEIEQDQKVMFENIVDFRDADVAKVMTPRTEMVTIEAASPLHEAIEKALSTGHSRLPVYRGNRDNIVGILHLRDVLEHWGKPDAGELTLERVVREPVYVPETKKISELFQEMKRGKFQFAIVVDEYGGTSGLVTTDDIVEEIVGDIQDEYKPEPQQDIRRVSEDAIEVDGRTRVDKVNEALLVSLPEHASYDTIGGFVFATLGRVPRKGDRLEHDGVEIVVIEASERRIHRLRVTARRQPKLPDE